MFGIIMFLFIIFIILLLIYAISNAFSGGKPKALITKGSNEFFSTLPKDFGYAYFNDNTGYAINMVEKKILLNSNSIQSIYNISDIRNVKKVWYAPGKFYREDNSLKSILLVEKLNRESEEDAYNKSGLFITVSDIKNPVYQIKFISEFDLNKSYEIFLQAMEGRLPQKSYSDEGIECPMCGNRNVQKAYIENGGMGDWCPDCKMSLKMMKGEL